MSQIIVLGQFDIHSEDSDEAAELMRVMMIETMKEPGCKQYAYSRDLATQHRFQLSELWESDEALSAHFKTEHMAVYRAGMSKLRIERRMVHRYDAANVKEL